MGLEFLGSLPGPIGRFFLRREAIKMLRGSASFVLEELAKGVNETIQGLDTDGHIDNPKRKEFLKSEMMILSFWYLQVVAVFPYSWHKLLLDEVHEQYLEALGRHGYDFKMRKYISEIINTRYKTYKEVLDKGAIDYSKLGVLFSKVLSEGTKLESDIVDTAVPVLLLSVLKPKFESFQGMLKT